MGATTTYTYATNTPAYLNPHAVATTTAGSAYAYTYDNNGNLLTQRIGTSTPIASHTWDYNNRLTQTVGNSATTTYGYDPFGQRVSMTVATTSSATTYYPTKNYNITGSVPTKHIFLPDGTMIATVVGTGTSTTVSYIHTDHLGGTNVVTSDAGEISQIVDVYPYGTFRIDEQTGFNEQRKGISGHEYDSATDLTYANARYYYGTNGKFISQDPLFINAGFNLKDPQGMNSYAYARNNPLKYYDPNGKWFKDFLLGRQSWSSFSVEVGDAANYLYDNSGAWQTAMDHPYATGAVVGVAGGLAAAGGALAVEAAAPVVSQLASDVVGGMSVGRSITGAALNVGAKALEGQVEHRKISAGEYLYAGVTGAVGTSKYFDGLGPQAKFASSANLLGQGIFKGPQNIDWNSVVISGLSSGLTTKIVGMPSQNAVPQVYRFITEQVLVFTTDTAGQTINSGIQNSKK